MSDPTEIDPTIPFRVSDKMRMKAIELKVNAMLFVTSGIGVLLIANLITKALGA